MHLDTLPLHHRCARKLRGSRLLKWGGNIAFTLAMLAVLAWPFLQEITAEDYAIIQTTLTEPGMPAAYRQGLDAAFADGRITYYELICLEVIAERHRQRADQPPLQYQAQR